MHHALHPWFWHILTTYLYNLFIPILGRPFECLQGPGDLIIVPPMWGHGVMYLDDTAGMATLFMA